MAITINQSPNSYSGFRQRNNIIVASSTSIAQDGFKYKVTVEAGGRQWYQGYIAPNPVDTLVFDLYPILSQIGSMTNTSNQSIHKFASNTRLSLQETYPDTAFTYEDEPVVVTVDEAWLVAGVLTDNPDIHAADVMTKIFINRSPQFDEGFNPNPNTTWAKYDTASGTTRRMLTDRTWETLNWDMSQSIGLGAPNNTKLYVRATKDDYGLWSIPYTSQTDKNANGLSNYAATKLRVSLLPTVGSPIDYDENLASLDPDDGVVHFGAYPANIRASTIAGLSGMQTHLNANTWYALYIRLLNASNQQVSMTHIMYNASLFGATDCRYDNVRLGWLNSQGGWDYFNFIKRNEKSYQVDRKQFKSITGNYATATNAIPFGVHQYERGVTQTQATTERYIEIISDWLTEGEFILMTSLITSPDVYIIDTNGNATAVIVDKNDHTEKKERTGKKYNVTMRLRYAQDYWT